MCEWDTPDFDDLWRRLGAWPLSPRVEALHAGLLARYAALGRRIYTEEADARARDAALLQAYRETPNLPVIQRRARALTRFAAGALVAEEPDALLRGRQTFNRGLHEDPETGRALQALGYRATTGHIVHDYAGLLRGGIDGCRREIADRQAQTCTPAASITLAAFAEAMDAFATFATRHAVTTTPPRTFHDALQLLWLAHVFLHAENPSVAISFGRLDQLLWPFLRDDLIQGHTTLADARDLLGAFLLKCCEGEESQNVVLGGMDSDGGDAGNVLTLLFLDAMRRLRTFQPSYIVRLHPGTPPGLLRAACATVAAGTGNPGFMHDPVVIAGLVAAGIPVVAARDYGVVGCYEATLPGACYPNTVLGRLHLVQALAAYLAEATADTFPAFLDGWFDHIARDYHAAVLPPLQQTWDALAAQAPSPFGSVLMRGCVERAVPLEAGGTDYNLVGINMLGLGTVVDSLHVIDTLVYRQGACTLAEMAAAVAGDFPDEAFHRRLLAVPGRYGTDDPTTNALAQTVSARLAALVLASRLRDGVRPYPAFFQFSADIYAVATTSPDGRRAGALISYGVGPAATTRTEATTLLRAAAHVAQDAAAGGCPLALTLPAADVAGPDGADRLAQLVQTYFALGGFHLHVNIATADDLRAAQRDPAHHAALTVRVSGYSARFVTVDPRWQDALIARAECGI